MRWIHPWVFAALFVFSTIPVFAAPAVKSKTSSAAKPKAVFTSVKGKVEIRQSGKKNRTVKKDSAASEGDRIVTSKDSTATLRFFDGSELRIAPKTEFRITKVRGDSKNKTLTFNLLLGKLWAKVKKLSSPRSSFEVEAGGVVCGVRGTEFSMDYHPDGNTLDLEVDDGTVYANSNGHSYDYQEGDQVQFKNGKPKKSPPGNGEPGASLDDLNDQFNGGLDQNQDNQLPGGVGNKAQIIQGQG